jgi:hypothetical protein
VYILAAKGNASRIHSSALHIGQEWLLLIVTFQGDPLLVKQLLAFAKHAIEEFLLLTNACVLLRLELHELHHEAACAQLVVESSLPAEFRH